MRAPFIAVLLVGCAPLVAGPGRVLPVALQYDAASFAGKPEAGPSTPARRLVLDNGVEVFWVEERTSPVVELHALVRCGRGDEPVGSPGLTELLLVSTFEAGAAENGAEEQRRAFQRLGAVPEVNVDDGESWVSFTTAPSHLASLVSLVRDAFGSARFEPGPVGRRRELSATSFDSPTYRQAAHERFLHNGAIYGSVPALSQRRTPQTERSLSVELLRAQSARCFQPPNLVLALTGNLTEASVREAVAPLGTLAGKTQVTHLAAGKPPGARTVWLAPARLDSRVQVTFIGPGLAPGSRERAAATVLLALLIDHVTWELRSQFGFVYSVDGAFEVGPGTGALWLRFTTRADVAFEAVRRALQLLQDWWDRWPLDPEVTARLAKSTREKAQRVPAPQRAFDAARARMQDGERFDDRTFVQQLDDLRAHQLSALFVRALAPERLQILVSGALDTRLDWKQFGKVVLAPVP